MKTIEELEAELETVTRERDKLSVLVELSDGYRRERDEARAYAEERNDEANKLQRHLNMAATERDEAKDKLEHYLRPASATESVRSAAKRRMVLDGADAQALENAITLTERERDEARADASMLEDRLAESRAEVERLADERDELLVRVADAGAELRATREAYNEARAELTRERIGIRPVDEVRSDAYRRGAEAMREACIAWARAPENDWEHLAHELEGMPILEES